MEHLVINVAGLLQEATGASRRVLVADLVPDWPELAVVSPIQGHVELCHAGKGIVVRSHLSAKIELTCCRCLEPYDQNVRVSFEELHYPRFDLATGKALRLEHEDIDAEFLIDNVNRFDLTESVRQHVVIGLPLMPRCHSGCLGICPDCGANRNETVCACPEDRVDVRMEPFREMLEHMAQNRSA